MKPNIEGLEKLREKIVRQYRGELAATMHEHFEFLVEHMPSELARVAPLSGSEVADVVETFGRMRMQLQKAWSRIDKGKDGKERTGGFVRAITPTMDPTRMTSRKRDIVNFIIRHNQILLGHDDPEALRLGIPPEGIFPNLCGETIVAWAHGRKPDAEVLREMARRRNIKKPMSDAEVSQMLQDKLDRGWQPDVNTWIGRWNRSIYITIYRTYVACFEFTEQIGIRYLRLDQARSDAFLGLPNENVADGIREGVFQEAQRKADETGLHVQIIDRQGNILGEKMPSQEIEAYVRQLAVRKGKASRGDWSRRKQLKVSEGRTLLPNPEPEEQLDFERMVLAEWGQLL